MFPTASPFTISIMTTQATSTAISQRTGTRPCSAPAKIARTLPSPAFLLESLLTTHSVVNSRPHIHVHSPTPEYAASAISPNGACPGDHDSTTNTDGVVLSKSRHHARSHQSQRALTRTSEVSSARQNPPADANLSATGGGSSKR
ncbi:hypothetical protein Q7P36_004750 [Cladosporium allicinum]